MNTAPGGQVTKKKRFFNIEQRSLMKKKRQHSGEKKQASSDLGKYSEVSKLDTSKHSSLLLKRFSSLLW